MNAGAVGVRPCSSGKAGSLPDVASNSFSLVLVTHGRAFIIGGSCGDWAVGRQRISGASRPKHYLNDLRLFLAFPG